MPASLRAAARDYVARALLAGTTTLDRPSRIAQSDRGLAASPRRGVPRTRHPRACFVTARPSAISGRDEARRGLAECRRIPASPLVRGLVGLARQLYRVRRDRARSRRSRARTRHRGPRPRGRGHGRRRRRAIARRSRDRWSACSRSTRCRPARSWHTASTERRASADGRAARRAGLSTIRDRTKATASAMPALRYPATCRAGNRRLESRYGGGGRRAVPPRQTITTTAVGAPSGGRPCVDGGRFGTDPQPFAPGAVGDVW